MNRWHVYEAMKQHYAATGLRMTIPEVAARFGEEMSAAEIAEGIEEFTTAFGSDRTTLEKVK